MPIVAHLARALEDGAVPPSALARAAASAWAFAASRGVARPLRLPQGVRVVAIGGATLGGSGKTPVALACALHYGSSERVALVGHAYRASPGVAREVSPDDDAAIVGDEALACARALHASGAGNARVVVAPRRQAAIDFAVARGASVLVLDGVSQTAPRRASLALLAVDAEAPWGAGASPPLGDLRAPAASLVEACDAVIALRDDQAPPSPTLGGLRPVHTVDVLSRGVWIEGVLVAWPDVSRLRVGLVTSIARPSRVVAALARRGVVPSEIAFGVDHRAPPLPSSLREVDLWLTTSKCAAHVTDGLGRPHPRTRRTLRGVPLAHIDHIVSAASFRAVFAGGGGPEPHLDHGGARP